MSFQARKLSNSYLDYLGQAVSLVVVRWPWTTRSCWCCLALHSCRSQGALIPVFPAVLGKASRRISCLLRMSEDCRRTCKESYCCHQLLLWSTIVAPLSSAYFACRSKAGSRLGGQKWFDCSYLGQELHCWLVQQVLILTDSSFLILLTTLNIQQQITYPHASK